MRQARAHLSRSFFTRRPDQTFDPASSSTNPEDIVPEPVGEKTRVRKTRGTSRR